MKIDTISFLELFGISIAQGRLAQALDDMDDADRRERINALEAWTKLRARRDLRERPSL